jgi:hypothetical protein
MNRVINLNNKEINYQLKSSHRFKRISLKVYGDGLFVVTKPKIIGISFVEKFIKSKSKWIMEKLNIETNCLKPKERREKYLVHKESARCLIEKKVQYFSKMYGFLYNKISIRNQSTRWGSCSKRGNLSFNYKIMFLPDNFINYIIVHELCHLKEFNHSNCFWSLVGSIIPDYKHIKKAILSHHL